MTLSSCLRASRAWLLLSLALLPFASPAGAPAQPAEFRGNYEVLRNDVPEGTATLTLERRGDGSWDLRTLTTGTQGLAGLAGVAITEESILEWRDGRPELVSYRYDQRAAWKSKQRSMLRHGDSILCNSDGHEAALAFEPGVVDRHAVMLAIAADLASGSGTLSYRVADKGRLETHTYRNAGIERTASPAGNYETIRVERVRETPGRTTTSWLAPELGYMPVRVVQREPDGDSVEMRLRSVPRR